MTIARSCPCPCPLDPSPPQATNNSSEKIHDRKHFPPVCMDIPIANLKDLPLSMELLRIIDVYRDLCSNKSTSSTLRTKSGNRKTVQNLYSMPFAWAASELADKRRIAMCSLHGPWKFCGKHQSPAFILMSRGAMRQLAHAYLSPPFCGRSLIGWLYSMEARLCGKKR